MQASCGRAVNSYATEVPSGFQFELPRAKSCWFALYQRKAEKGWLLTSCTRVPNMPEMPLLSDILHTLNSKPQFFFHLNARVIRDSHRNLIVFFQ